MCLCHLLKAHDVVLASWHQYAFTPMCLCYLLKGHDAVQLGTTADGNDSLLLGLRLILLVSRLRSAPSPMIHPLICDYMSQAISSETRQTNYINIILSHKTLKQTINVVHVMLRQYRWHTDDANRSEMKDANQWTWHSAKTAMISCTFITVSYTHLTLPTIYSV